MSDMPTTSPLYDHPDLEIIERRRRQFIVKYGPHDVAEDLRLVLDEVYNFRRKEADYGFRTGDDKLQMAALKHLCTRTHKYDPNKCAECWQAQQVMNAIRGKEIK